MITHYGIGMIHHNSCFRESKTLLHTPITMKSFQILFVYIVFCRFIRVIKTEDDLMDEQFLMNIYNTLGEDFISEPIDLEPIKSAVKKQFHHLEKKGEDIIPITSYEKIILNGGRLPENIERKLKRRGILVIRNTIPPELITHWETNILRYLYDNNAFPKKNKVCI